MSASDTFLIAMLLVFALPYLVWRVFKTDYYAPLVVVQLIAGVILGPGIMGRIFPHYYEAVFSKPVITALNGIAQWAVMVFVWSAGLELDLAQAWKRRGEVSLTAGLALATPLGFGAVASLLLMTLPGWIGTRGSPWQALLGVGMACAVTALPILVLFLKKLNLLERPLGQEILRYASLDDIAIWGVLALIMLDFKRAGLQLAFFLVFTVAAFVIRPLMRRLPPADRWYVALIWLIGAALGADWAGLHFIVGAFLSGAVLDAEMFDKRAVDRFRDVVLLVLMPVFFLSTGLRTTWSINGVAVFGAAALLLAASVGGKLAGVHIAGRLLKWERGKAGLIGWLLQTKALIMIIFANILLDKGIIGGTAFTALLLMAIASTMLTIPMSTLSLGRLGRREQAHS